MDKIISVAIGTVTVFVFGPVLIGAFTNAVWPGFVNLLAYIFWFFVAIAAVVGLVVLSRKLSIKIDEERFHRELEEERQSNLRRQRRELEALHTQVSNAYHDVFDGERRR